MYAVVKIAGEQVRAETGKRIRVPLLALDEGSEHEFSDVLLVSNGEGQMQVGTPTVTGAAVRATVVGHGKAKKVVVFKMKRRKGYRRRNGHRQSYTEIQVNDIVVPNQKPV